MKIVVISSETPYFYSRTALMYIFMGHMRWEDTKPYEDHFWEKNSIELIQGTVTEIDHLSKEIVLSSTRRMSYSDLILATGSKPRKLPIEKKDIKGVCSLYHLDDLDKIDTAVAHASSAVIVGGGLIGIELAEMLHSRGLHVRMIIREQTYWGKVLPAEEGRMIERHILDRGIEVISSRQVAEIEADDHQNIKGVRLDNGERIATDFLGVTIGVVPNVAWLSDSDLDVNHGILVSDYLRTNIDNIYAIGDCAELRMPMSGRRSIEAVWYTARQQGECVAQTICGRGTKYQPSLWFNSAKFFDLEYHVYGEVLANDTTGHQSYLWQDKHKECLLRIAYNTENQVIGIHSLGIRLKHEVCHQWITERWQVTSILNHLETALFDPEFSYNPCDAIRARYNAEFGTQTAKASKNFWQRLWK